MPSSELDNIISQFDVLTSKPVKYLSVQHEIKDDVKNLVKSLYDFTKSQEGSKKKNKGSALSDLIVKDFDEEQIWQQIELQNSQCYDKFVRDTAHFMSIKNDLKYPVEIIDPSKDVNQLENTQSDQEDSSAEDSANEDSAIKMKTKLKSAKNKSENVIEAVKSRKYNEPNAKRKSVVDDDFFKLHEMEQFLLKEEKMDDKKPAKDSDEESIDMFDDIDDDESVDEEGEETKEMMYNDFFSGDGDDTKMDEDVEENDYDEDDQDNQDNDDEAQDDFEERVENPNLKNDRESTKKKVTFADQDTKSIADLEKKNSSSNKNTDTFDRKSEFEQRQERLKTHIERLEQKTLKDAPWQLKGEVDASNRPVNSLLQEVVDFDLTSRPAPIITEQTTITLEGLIQQRIKDKAWDDVVKKEKPVDDQLSFRKTEVLDQSKSKLSLAQIYEAEYLKQKQSASGEIEEEKEPEEHKEIRDKMNTLFHKLDALCHYHYTPKVPQAEVKIVTNTPAISMEEVAPVATSDAALLAPEEIKKTSRGEIMSKEERTKTDKNRERRKKKMLQKSKGKIEKVTEHRNTKKGVEVADRSLKTSKAFFQQLNDNATSLIKKPDKNTGTKRK